MDCAVRRLRRPANGGGGLGRNYAYRGYLVARNPGAGFYIDFIYVSGGVMERSTLDLWVGLFVCAGIGALLVLALKVGNMSGFDAKDTYQLQAKFDNIGGLKIRAPVKSAGVVIGRVANIQFDDARFKATVAMSIDQHFKFPKDTSASILTSGLLGEQYIGLDAGGDETMLKDGDSITLTQSAVVLEEMIGKFLYNKAAEGNTSK